MDGYNLYRDIATRTGGSVYIGVVGPVRTGKSTFIKKVMETLVLPNIENEYKREQATDELPQSASGRMIMTTEPKFVPNEAVEVSLAENATVNMRLIDCVGYVIEGAAGYLEENAPRMVNTPWSNEPMPFNAAAEMGTRKVINEHSTVGVLVTTDGTICDIPRENYEAAEERVVSELKSIQKPFVILLNSAHPRSESAIALRDEMYEKYDVPVILLNCLELNGESVADVFKALLYEFPISEMDISLPKWLVPLEDAHWLKSGVFDAIKSFAKDARTIRDARNIPNVSGGDYIESIAVSSMALGEGKVNLNLNLFQTLYYKLISELSGIEINDESRLIDTIRDLSHVKREYDKIAPALEEVKVRGYGIVSPAIDELTLQEPEIMKQGGRFGIRLRASAPSIHMIRADINTEVSPIVGSERQSQELINYLLSEFEVDPKKIWESNFFGKSLHELVSEGLKNKIFNMPDDARYKLQETLQRIINEGSGGLICIIL